MQDEFSCALCSAITINQGVNYTRKMTKKDPKTLKNDQK